MIRPHCTFWSGGGAVDAEEEEPTTVPVQVAVCGPRDCGPRDAGNAREVGRLLADAGAVVLCGGYGGVMAEVAAGAREHGDTVVGVLSGSDRSSANPDLGIVLCTGMGQARNTILVASADAVIVVGGSWGTLSELALAMRRATAPVITLGGWRVLDEHGHPVPGAVPASSPAEAVNAALDRAVPH